LSSSLSSNKIGWWCTLVLSAWGLEQPCCCRGLLQCDCSRGSCDLSWSIPCLWIDEGATFFDQYNICHSIIDSFQDFENSIWLKSLFKSTLNVLSVNICLSNFKIWCLFDQWKDWLPS
jgi:hypothetical protein